MKALVNGKIICGSDIITGQAILYDNKIRAIVPVEQVVRDDTAEIIDAKNDFVSAGFINVHIHGCAGVDTMDESAASIQLMQKSLPQTGVTAFLPTTMTCDLIMIKNAMQRIRQSMNNLNGAKILGANMEGPFISNEYKGAHDSQYIANPDYGIISEYADIIRIMTVAPETITDSTFIDKCKKQGILLSLGHSAATYAEAKKAIAEGFNHITHMYNAMPVFNHRQPGVIGAAMDTTAMCELIADNVHVHPAMQRILLKQKGISQVVLVTDSMRACMLADGKYDLGGQAVFVNDGVAKLKNGVIAGSVLTLNRALKNFRENTGISIPEAVETVTINPAKELAIYDQVGSIAVDKCADITIFNDSFEIQMTIINGKAEYRRV